MAVTSRNLRRPPKNAVSVNLQNKFATTTEVFLQTAIEVFLYLPNFLPSRYGLWANFDEMCLWINICEQPQVQKENVWMLNLNWEYI